MLPLAKSESPANVSFGRDCITWRYRYPIRHTVYHLRLRLHQSHDFCLQKGEKWWGRSRLSLRMVRGISQNPRYMEVLCHRSQSDIFIFILPLVLDRWATTWIAWTMMRCMRMTCQRPVCLSYLADDLSLLILLPTLWGCGSFPENIQKNTRLRAPWEWCCN